MAVGVGNGVGRRLSDVVFVMVESETESVLDPRFIVVNEEREYDEVVLL